MANSQSITNSRRLLIFCLAFAALSIAPVLSRAQPATSVNIVNNSSGVIRHVYVSHVNADDWSSDLLSNGPLYAGQSVTVSGFTCDQQQMKIIGENQDGCFVSTVVACGDSATWTITNETAADCGQ
jgi:hypothetical protein